METVAELRHSGELSRRPGGAMEGERMGKWKRVSGASYSPSVQAKWGRESAAMKAAAQSPAGRHFRAEEGEGDVSVTRVSALTTWAHASGRGREE